MKWTVDQKWTKKNSTGVDISKYLVVDLVHWDYDRSLNFIDVKMFFFQKVKV